MIFLDHLFEENFQIATQSNSFSFSSFSLNLSKDLINTHLHYQINKKGRKRVRRGRFLLFKTEKTKILIKCSKMFSDSGVA